MKPVHVINKLNEFEETPRSVESLKCRLEDLADKDFYHNMKDHWTQEDFDLDTKISKEIISIQKQLYDQGVVADYRMGYDIKYSKREDDTNE